MKEEKKQIGVILPKALVEQLDQAAKNQGLKRSGYIRQLLIQVLNQ
jgi:metal-responsive CopG/Arc/MetJ family transcriptional regulator